MRSARLAAFALLLALPGLSRADSLFYLKDGDRVVFYGDSITDQRLYTTFVETYAVTRFPKLNLTFVHSGWGGDRVTGGGGGPVDVRLERDVEAYKPSVVTIMLGMNDASYQPFREPIFNTYADGYKHIIEKLKADVPNLRITVIKPSPYDDVTREPKFPEGYNSVLVRYGEFLQKLADEAKLDVADLNTSVVEATKKAFASDPKGAENLNKDRVHPGPGGQLLMAEALLKAWNAPSVVSSVTINASEGKVTASDKAEVSDLTVKDGVIRWTQLDEALPFPINLKDEATDLAVRSSDVVEALDQQILKVDGLESDYTLTIDGENVGTFGKDQLAQGVNLAVLATPMSEQANKVHGLTLSHTGLHQMRWRTVQVPYQATNSPNLAKAIEALDALEAEIIAEQKAAAQPKPHTFELKPKA
ncbi:SGNH/GDSL hydrolase family protein [Tundrisphaera lichenicola]|uniref:SGNH/GDSL hydrolase family protein n=1 Tax=Tundrisphaera lichenicola TaxID=2029860 RepID=UPI003EBA7156